MLNNQMFIQSKMLIVRMIDPSNMIKIIREIVNILGVLVCVNAKLERGQRVTQEHG